MDFWSATDPSMCQIFGRQELSMPVFYMLRKCHAPTRDFIGQAVKNLKVNCNQM